VSLSVSFAVCCERQYNPPATRTTMRAAAGTMTFHSSLPDCSVTDAWLADAAAFCFPLDGLEAAGSLVSGPASSAAAVITAARPDSVSRFRR
jgi:hypothetical protein